MTQPCPPQPDLRACRDAMAADLVRVALRDRWGLALIAIGWVHLATFLTCHALDRLASPHAFYPLAWGLEFAAVLGILRSVLGRGWIRTTPLAGLIARVWGTFLILSFNLVSLNALMGNIATVAWFKPALATLSSFGFMITAYLVGMRFFIPAVVMYVTGLLMIAHPSYGYPIYGVSWWGTLQVIGLLLERRRPLPGPWRRVREGASRAVGSSLGR